MVFAIRSRASCLSFSSLQSRNWICISCALCSELSDPWLWLRRAAGWMSLQFNLAWRAPACTQACRRPSCFTGSLSPWHSSWANRLSEAACPFCTAPLPLSFKVPQISHIASDLNPVYGALLLLYHSDRSQGIWVFDHLGLSICLCPSHCVLSTLMHPKDRECKFPGINRRVDRRWLGS